MTDTTTHLQYDVLDIFEVLNVLVALLGPLVTPDLLLQHLGQLPHPRRLGLRLGEERGEVGDLLLGARGAALGGLELGLGGRVVPAVGGGGRRADLGGGGAAAE